MTKIKICGLTRMDDIQFVNSAMPDYIGFVFAKSKRQIDLEQARILKGKLSEAIEAVGVFVNEDIEFINKLCQGNMIDIIQLHGDEDEAYIAELKKVVAKPIIKAARIKNQQNVVYTTADYMLFDTFSKEQYGGTGESFNWEFVKDYEKPFFLAGGLGIDNVKSAIKMAKPYCVDVSSGVETDGKKDSQKIINMVNMVRSMNKDE